MTNCTTCRLTIRAHGFLFCDARENTARVAEWSETHRSQRTGEPLPGATGCPSHKPR